LYTLNKNRSHKPASRYPLLNFIEDYICRENSWQIAIIDYLFSTYFHRGIFCVWIYAMKIDVRQRIDRS